MFFLGKREEIYKTKTCNIHIYIYIYICTFICLYIGAGGVEDVRFFMAIGEFFFL